MLNKILEDFEKGVPSSSFEKVIAEEEIDTGGLGSYDPDTLQTKINRALLAIKKLPSEITDDNLHHILITIENLHIYLNTLYKYKQSQKEQSQSKGPFRPLDK